MREQPGPGHQLRDGGGEADAGSDPAAPAADIDPAGGPARCTALTTHRGTGGKYDLSADDLDWVERTVAALGPLTDKQRDALGRLLRGSR